MPCHGEPVRHRHTAKGSALPMRELSGVGAEGAMSEGPQREMSLGEWMAALPKSHRARVELASLERELAEARGGLLMAYERGQEAREAGLRAIAERDALRAEVEAAARWSYHEGYLDCATKKLRNVAAAWSRYQQERQA